MLRRQFEVLGVLCSPSPASCPSTCRLLSRRSRWKSSSNRTETNGGERGNIGLSAPCSSSKKSSLVLGGTTSRTRRKASRGGGCVVCRSRHALSEPTHRRLGWGRWIPNWRNHRHGSGGYFFRASSAPAGEAAISGGNGVGTGGEGTSKADLFQWPLPVHHFRSRVRLRPPSLVPPRR